MTIVSGRFNYERGIHLHCKPYAYDALEYYIDKETNVLHHETFPNTLIIWRVESVGVPFKGQLVQVDSLKQIFVQQYVIMVVEFTTMNYSLIL